MVAKMPDIGRVFDLIFDILWELPIALGLKRIGSPRILRDGKEWMGFVFLAESHISIQTKETEMILDILACRQFSPEIVELFLKGKNFSNIRMLD